MYTDGSNALKIEYGQYGNDSRQNREQHLRKQQAKKRHNKMRVLKKRIVSAALLAFAMAFIVLFRYGTITEEYSRLSEVRSELELINSKIVAKKVQAEGNMDPKRIEKEAERLGLKPPSKNQIKYISLGNTDNGEVLKEERPGNFSAFANRISVILEYLY